MGLGRWAGREGWLQSQLQPGEHVLWAGQPDALAYCLRGAWYLVPFSLLWAGFAFFWEASALVSGAPLFFDLWGIPFVLIGLYLVVGRFYVAIREARRTIYAVTDRRVLIRSGAFRPSLTEMALLDLPSLRLDREASGIGTVTFGAVVAFFRAPPGWPTFGAYAGPPAFASIPDAGRVYRIIQEAKAEARGR
jgi:hypothetical protein